jgi:hypothetical protein
MPRRLIAGRRRLGGADGLCRPLQSLAFLLLMFVVWVASTFVLAGPRRVAITVGSLAIYAAEAFDALHVKLGSLFLVVPLASRGGDRGAGRDAESPVVILELRASDEDPGGLVGAGGFERPPPAPKESAWSPIARSLTSRFQ